MIVTVKDTQGATVTQNFTIGVVADTEAPQVTLRATRNLLNVGEEITFEAQAIDNVSVAGLKLVVNGQAIGFLGEGRSLGTIGRCAPYLYEQDALPDNYVTILRTDSLDPVYLSIYLNSIIGKLQVENTLKVHPVKLSYTLKILSGMHLKPSN